MRICKKHLLWASCIIALGSFYLFWTYLSSSSIKQEVSFTPAEKECFSGGKNAAWRTCIYTSVNGSNGGIAYHLHGRNLDETVWNDRDYYTSLIQQYWANRNVKPPKVVSVTFGPVWLFAPSSNSDADLANIFKNEVIAEVEKRTGKPTYRTLFGESMGGLNSLVLGLKTKGLFNKIASLCPPLYKESPFSGFSNIRAFLERTGAEPRTILGILALGKKYMRGEEDWKEFSPIEILDHIDISKTPKIYLSCGLYDKYGNFEGADFFVKKASKMGMKIDWRPLYGGHCAVDVASVAEFLL